MKIINFNHVKLYYPFLQETTYLNNYLIHAHISNILKYLLLVEYIVLPPRAFFRKEILDYLKLNSNINRVFLSFIQEGKIHLIGVEKIVFIK